MTDSLDRLFVAILSRKSVDPTRSRTARLLGSGRAKMGKKLVEEAVEVVIDALSEDKEATIRESADLIYHLVALWAACGVLPNEVWSEMERRERLFGIAEKLQKNPADAKLRHSIVALETARVRKRG